MDVALLTFLIFLNALFAMSEMALTASRKARLQVMVETGDAGARAAMDLHDDPTKFLSTVQIGITSIGVLNGIVRSRCGCSRPSTSTIGRPRSPRRRWWSWSSPS
jgi:putative hemolysin